MTPKAILAIFQKPRSCRFFVRGLGSLGEHHLKERETNNSRGAHQRGGRWAAGQAFFFFFKGKKGLKKRQRSSVFLEILSLRCENIAYSKEKIDLGIIWMLKDPTYIGSNMIAIFFGPLDVVP